MASKDAPQEKRAMPNSSDEFWDGLSKYLQQIWDQARTGEYEQLLKSFNSSSSTSSSSDVGNLQIFDGPRRC